MIVFCSYSRQVWGAERSLLQLISSRSRTDDVLVVTDTESALTDDLSSRGIPTQSFRFAGHPALADGSLANASKWDLFRECLGVLFGGMRLALSLKRHRRQITALVAFSTWQTPEVIVAARLLRVPVAVDLHDTFASQVATRAVRRLARWSDLTLVPTQSLADRYELSEGVSVVPRPIDNLTGKLPTSPRNVTIGIFGQIVEHKRVLEVAGSFSGSVTDPSARLIICGLSDTPTEYERRVLRVAEADRRIEVVRRQSDVTEPMRACSVIVNFSDHEAFGRTLAEGAMLGCIPVGRAGTGGEDVVRTLGFGQVAEHLSDLGGALTDAVVEANRTERTAVSTAAQLAFGATTISARYFSQLQELSPSGMR